MIKSKHKKLGTVIGLGLGLLLLTGCTASFCSDEDKANMLYPYEQGVTVYCDYEDLPSDYASTATKVFEDNDTLYKYIPYDADGNFSAAKSTFLNSVIDSAKNNGIPVPSNQYFAAVDQKVVEVAVDAYISYINGLYPSAGLTRATITAEHVNAYTVPDTDGDSSLLVSATVSENSYSSALRLFGYLKYWGPSDNETVWGYYNTWLNEFRVSEEEGLGYLNCPGKDFLNLYKTNVENKISAARSCIAIRDGYYGNYGSGGDWTVEIEAKDWGYAWSRGFLEGLLVYPIAWLTDTIAYAISPDLTGLPQIAALCIVTLIVRAFMVLVSFRSTMSQQRMQALQPQLAKLQAKYPNSNTNQAQKQRLAQEQMALYKRNKVHPFSAILVMIVQFPLFICVWSAFQGASSLSTGSVLNLSLSTTIQSTIFNFSGTWYLNTHGWWTALVLFLLMAGAQICSMLLPQLINKRRMKDVQKLSKNPAQDKNSKTMKYVMYGMMIFTIIMGFFLPSAMAVYWFIGALISMAQTAITQAVIANQAKKQKDKKRR